MNILEMIKDQLSPNILGQISKTVGESPEGTKSALQTALPALLGSAAAQASSPGGATGLLDLLKRQAPPGGWSDSASDLVGGAGTSAGAGSSFVSSLLGPKMNMVRDFIANRSGIKSDSATSLLGTGGQMLMGTLGKQVTAGGLGASGLGQLLSSQIPHLKGMVPPELANKLGIGNFLGVDRQTVSDAASRVQPAYEHARASGSNALRWAIPLAVLLGILAIAYFSTRNRTRNVGGTADETATVQNTGSSITGGLMEHVKGAINRADGTPVELPGVNFDQAGNLSATAQTELSQVGKLVNQAPNLRAQVTAYGDSIEDATKKANAIKTALTKTGLGEERVTTQPEVGQGAPKISFAK